MMIELRENEQKILLALERLGGKGNIEQIAETSGLAHAAVMRAFLTLTEKKLTEIHEKRQTLAKLSPEGGHHAKKGLPERRLIRMLLKMGGEAPVDEVVKKAGLEREFLAIGLGWLHRKGWAKMEKNLLRALQEPPKGTDEVLLALLNERGSSIVEELSGEQQDAVSVLKGRKLVELDEKTLRELELTEGGWKLIRRGIEVVEEVSQLTPELIVTGKWREVKLRRYNIAASTSTPIIGKKHPYREIVDEIREILIGLGFEEVSSPPIEVNFWNCDILFMPSDHPARGIHDIFHLTSAEARRVAPKDVWEKVRRIHENGWITGSTGWGHWNPKLALRLILRSQTTAVSARYLLTLKAEELPKKIFTIDRNYRPDRIDSTHLPEFNQCEGIVAAEDVNFRHLIGFIKTIAEAFRIREIKLQPAFFPFTEPSVVGYVKHPKLGWIEALPGGIFRPEVTKPLGINVPVLAWGLGIDRLAMVTLGIDDIRMLFTQDLEWLRSKKIPSVWEW